MNNLPRRLIQGSVIFVLIGVVLSLFLISKQRHIDASVPIAVPVRVEKPISRTLEDTVRAYGNVRSANQVTLLPKVSGTITEMDVDVGDLVDEGMLLAMIDREAYEWDLKRAEAAFASTSSTWERVNRLYDTGNATRQSWEEARAANAAAEAQAAAARLRYDWTRVVSPVRGAVLVKYVNTGSLVAPEASTPIFTIGSLEDLELELHLPDTRYPSFVRELPRARAIVEGNPDLELDVAVKSAAPWVDPATRTFSVMCRVIPGEESRDYIRPGMLISVDFILDVKENVLTLPVSALAGGRWIWSVDSEGKARRHELTSPFISAGFVQVPEDWRSDRFVVEGQHFLTEGAALKILGGENP